MLKRCAVLIFTVFALGCHGGLEQVVPPRATVVGVELIEQTRDGARVEVVIGVGNPNRAALPLAWSRYTLAVDGVGEFTFSDDPNRTVPAGQNKGANSLGWQKVRLPLAFATNGASLRGARFDVRGDLHYQPPGEIRKILINTKTDLPSVRFDGQGVIQ